MSQTHNETPESHEQNPVQKPRLGKIFSVVTGTGAIIAGVLILSSPAGTLTVFALIFGMYFVLSGLFSFVLSLFEKNLDIKNRIFDMLFGLALMLIGLICVVNPRSPFVALGLLLGIAWVIEGIALLMSHARLKQNDPQLLTRGILAMIGGIAILVLPLAIFKFIVIVAGILLIIGGGLQLWQNRETPQESQELPASS